MPPTLARCLGIAHLPGARLAPGQLQGAQLPQYNSKGKHVSCRARNLSRHHLGRLHKAEGRAGHLDCMPSPAGRPASCAKVLLARIDKLGLHAAYQPAGVRSRHAAGIWRGRVQQLGQVQVTDLQARCNMAGSGDKSPAVHSQQMMFCTHSPQQSLLLESSAASAEQALRQRHSVVCHFPLQSICHLPIRLET